MRLCSIRRRSIDGMVDRLYVRCLLPEGPHGQTALRQNDFDPGLRYVPHTRTYGVSRLTMCY